MGKCSECGKKILYNKFRMYRGKVLCPECYDTRLDRKAAKKAELKAKADAVKITIPTKKAKKAAKKKGLMITGNFTPSEDVIPDFYGGDSKDEKAEDTTPKDSD